MPGVRHKVAHLPQYRNKMNPSNKDSNREELNRNIPDDVWERKRIHEAELFVQEQRERLLRSSRDGQADSVNIAQEEKVEVHDDGTAMGAGDEPTYVSTLTSAFSVKHDHVDDEDDGEKDIFGREDEYDRLLEDEDWVLDAIQKEREEEELEKKRKEEARAKDGRMRLVQKKVTSDDGDDDFEGANGYPSFIRYLREISVDPNMSWGSKQFQTATVLLEMEHDRRRSPNRRDLILSVLRKKKASGQEYMVGHWAEILAPNMTWTLEKIYYVHHGDDEGKFLYNVGTRRRLSPYEIRVPEEGIRILFGNRPWIWQQWAFVKLEQKLRFQENHHDDFEVFHIPEYARDLWFEWLLDPDNKDFFDHLKDSRLNACQDDLFDHIMKPFYILDDMRRGDQWNFEDCSDVSVFTYLSLQGTGYVFCLITLILQFTIPVVIIYSSIDEADYYNDPIENKDVVELLVSMFCVTDPSSFCVGLRLTTFIVLCIQLLYLCKVIPDTSCVFSDVAGVGGYGPEKTYAKVKSIREEVRSDNNDRTGQLIGSMMDMYMNTLYVYLLFAINLYNILNQASPVEVILNALALEFVFKIDEEYAIADWWDPSRRWYKASAMETFIQSKFESRVLKSPRLFSDKYGMDSWEVKAVVGDGELLCDVALSKEDRMNIGFMNHTELFEHFCRIRAVEMNQAQFDEFVKPSVVFGGLEQVLYKTFALMKKYSLLSIIKNCLGIGKDLGSSHEGFGVFYRLQDFQTWSRWRKVLFLASIPKVEELFEKNKYGDDIVKKELERRSKDDQPIANFQKDIQNPLRAFQKKRITVLEFRKLRENFRFALYLGKYDRAILSIFDGIMEWIAYIVQVGFPLYNLFLFGFAFYCYTNEISETLSTTYEGRYRCDCQATDPSTFVRFGGDGVTCEIAWLYSIYTGGEIDQETGVITYDCDILTDDLRENYDTTEVGVAIVEALEEYYQTKYNLTRSESDYVAFCNQRKMDVQNACSNWQNEIEYRYGLESSSDLFEGNMYYEVCCTSPDEALVPYPEELVARICY